MAKLYNDNDISVVDEYRLSDVILYSYAGNPINITPFLMGMDIYESIYSNCITGSLTLADTQGLTERTPIIGQEYLEFKFRTPLKYQGDGGEYVAMETNRFAVTNVSTKQPATGQSQVVTLEFTSLENLRSARLRVSKAFTGSYDKAVNEIFKGEWGLNSSKKLFVERCAESQKYVVPNLHPLDAINQVCSRAISKKTNTPSFFFYETSQGFHFRSFDSMLREYSTQDAVKPTWHYFVESAYTPSPMPRHDTPLNLMKRVYKFGFSNDNDQIKNARRGSYASKLLAHDSYNKTITEKEFSYLLNYGDLPHLVTWAILADYHQPEGPIMPSAPADLVGSRKRASEYTDGRVMVQSTTTDVHNDNEGTSYHADKYAQKRQHITNLLNAIQITLEVPGNTHLNAGKTVEVSIPAYTTELHEKGRKQKDRFLSGQYLIVRLRHSISTPDQKHRTVITLSKESYNWPLKPNYGGPKSGTVYKKGTTEIGSGMNYELDKASPF